MHDLQEEAWVHRYNTLLSKFIINSTYQLYIVQLTSSVKKFLSERQSRICCSWSPGRGRLILPSPVVWTVSKTARSGWCVCGYQWDWCGALCVRSFSAHGTGSRCSKQASSLTTADAPIWNRMFWWSRRLLRCVVRTLSKIVGHKIFVKMVREVWGHSSSIIIINIVCSL